MRLSHTKAYKLKSGQTIYRIWILIRENNTFDVYPDRQQLSGKRTRHRNGQLIASLDGTYGGCYFTKIKQAERFCQEIRDGHHPALIAAAKEFNDDCNRLDSCLGQSLDAFWDELIEERDYGEGYVEY